MARRLRDKQERFVQEYLVDLNQTQAAIRAGFSPKSAREQGSVLMSNPNVRARVQELMAERSRRTGVNQDRVVRELARIAFVNALDVVDPDKGELKPGVSDEDAAAISALRVKRIPTDVGDGVEREIRFWDKNKALELLGKHLGMFTDRMAIEVTGVKIVDDIDSAGDDEE